MAERVGLKKAEHRKKNEPRWKRRIERDMKRLRGVSRDVEREGTICRPPWMVNEENFTFQMV